MAKAKTGGTTAKLRGVVGDYIYQIVKNPAGYTEQRVITYTREKYNANTRYQCLARMQITIFMNCMNLLTPIISDSFEGLRSRVNSCNRFVQVNIKLIQEYCAQHWFDALACQWPNKGNHNATYFPFWISEGSYQIPYIFSYQIIKNSGWWPEFRFDLGGTFGRKLDLRKALGFATGDALNIVYWSDLGRTLIIYSVQLDPLFNDYTSITSYNCRSLFKITQTVLGYKGINTITFDTVCTYDQSRKILTLRLVCWYQNEYSRFTVNPDFFTYIFSRRKGNTWQRNTNKFLVNNPDGEQSEFGDPPSEAYHNWDPDYDDQPYEEYFSR